MWLQIENTGEVVDVREVDVCYLEDAPALVVHEGTAYAFFHPHTIFAKDWKKLHAFMKAQGFEKVTAAEFKERLADPAANVVGVAGYSYNGFYYKRSARNDD